MTAGALNATELRPDGVADVLPVDEQRHPALTRRRVEAVRRRVQTPRAATRPTRSSRCAVASSASMSAASAIVVLVTNKHARGAAADPRRRRPAATAASTGIGASRAEDAELERRPMRRAGHARDEESHRGELHPRAEVRDEQPEPEQTKVAKAQRGEDRGRRADAFFDHAPRARTAATMSAVLCAASSRDVSMQRS